LIFFNHVHFFIDIIEPRFIDKTFNYLTGLMLSL